MRNLYRLVDYIAPNAPEVNYQQAVLIAQQLPVGAYVHVYIDASADDDTLFMPAILLRHRRNAARIVYPDHYVRIDLINP